MAPAITRSPPSCPALTASRRKCRVSRARSATASSCKCSRWRIDFQLKVGSLTETVEVSGGAPLLATENAAVGTVIENRRIVDLPLNGRNFIQLVALSPNVNANFANNGGQASSRQGGDRSTQLFSVAGMRREFNYFTLDGIANSDVNFNTYLFLPSIDALQEFKVQT